MKSAAHRSARSRVRNHLSRSARRRLVSSAAALSLTLGLAGAAFATISPDGSFVHGIDIRVPPGTNGMAPKVGLTYSSNAPNGPLGVGWRLVGLPTISRVSYGYGVNYDGADSYSAEGGGRLLRQSDNSYLPETWTGGKYVPHGSCGDGPCMWVLKSGSGIDMYFGGTNPASPAQDHSSRIYRTGATGAVRVWALAKVINTRDQLSYDVSYARDTAEGDYYPQTITYTTGPGLGAWKTVSFETEPRVDTAATFGQSGYERWDRRISLIRIAHNGRTLREYVLTYEVGSATGRSRIRSVQERGSNGGTLPAQTFTWQEGANSTGMERWMTNQPGTIAGGESTSQAAWFEGDFDGDGRTDRCKVWNSNPTPPGTAVDCYHATGTSFAHHESLRGDFPVIPTDTAGGWAQWFSGDVDGDGRTDLFKIYDDFQGTGRFVSINVHRSVGTSFTHESWHPEPGGPFPSTNIALGQSQWLSADFNGDGRTDLAAIYNNNGTMNADVYLSTGGSTRVSGGFVYRRWAVGQGGWISTAPGNSQWFAADFNGDGKADLAKIWNDGSTLSSDVHISTGSGFVMQRWATNQGGWISTDPKLGNSQWFAADFNGDGKTDLAKIWNVNATMNADVHLSTGRDFTMQRWATAIPGWVSTDVSKNNSQYFSGDFNGDGKTDLSRIWACSVGGMCMDVYAARAGAFAAQRWATSQGGWINTGERQWFSGDFNGDGRTDLAKFFGDTSGLSGDIHRAGGDTRPDLMGTIANGIGGVTSVTYALGLPASVVGTGCGLEAPGGGWLHGGSSGNGQVCGNPNVAPRPLVVRAAFNNGRAGDPGANRSTAYTYTNGRSKPSGFDEDDYRARHPDVAQSPYGSMRFGMEQHYNDFGRAEGRYMRMRGADLGFERYEERDEQTSALVEMLFRQDTPFETRPAQTTRTNGPVRLEERFNYSSWSPAAGTTGINDYWKNTKTFEGGVQAHSATQTKTLDSYGSMTRVVDDAGEGFTITSDTVFTHDAASWTIGRVQETKKVRTDTQNILEWEKVRYNTQGRVDLKQRWLCNDAAACFGSSGSWVTLASGHVYDAFGNLTSVRDARGNTTTTEYDPTYRAFVTKVISDATGLAHSRVMAYGILNGTSVDTETDASGQQTKTTTDQFGRKISIESPLGGLERFAYAGYGAVGQQYDETLTTVDSRTIRRRSYFDGASRVFKVESTGDDGKTIVVESEDFIESDGTRHSKESRPRFVGAPAVWTEMFYDLAGRQSRARLADGSVLTYAYGPGSASVTETVSAIPRTTTEYFTARGRMWKKVDTLGGALVLSYDEMQRPIRVTYQGVTQILNAYDSFGQKRSTTDYSSGTGRTTTFSYDVGGNQLETVEPRGHRIKFTYDNLNRITTKQRQLSGGTSFTTEATFTYDDATVAFSKGRLTRVTDPSGSTRFAYDARGRVTLRSTSISGLSETLTTSLAYDAVGRATAITFPNSGVQQMAYSDGGNLKQILYNGAEYAAFLDYSATGRVGFKRTPKTNTTATYDAKDLLSSLLTTNVVGRQLQNNTYTYDEAGNVSQILDARSNKIVNGVETNETQSFVYDQANRIVRATGAYGGAPRVVKYYAYDGGFGGGDTQPAGLGNLTDIGGTVQRALAYSGQRATSGTGFSASYDAAGNMTSKTLDGQTWTYVFDHNNRLTQVKRGGTTRLDIVYNYQGERVKKIFYPGGGRTITTYYVAGGYEVRTDSSAAGTFRRTVHLAADASGKVASITTSASSATIASLTSDQHRALAAGHDPSSVGGLLGSLFHLACAALPSPSRIAPALVILAALLSALLAGVTLWRQWGQRAHLRGSPASYHRRLPLQARLVVTPLLLVLLVNGTGCVSNRGGGVDVEQTNSALLVGDTTLGIPPGTTFYHQSHIGSSSVITDGEGNLTAHNSYLPFGEIDQARSAGSDVVTHKFASQELDEESGLAYYGARYYDPAIGRFLSADSVVPGNGNEPQAFNRYSLADNNPVTYTDPSGHWSWKGVWRATVNALSPYVKFAVALVVVVVIVAAAVATGGAAAAALGFAAGSFWGAVIAGGVSGFLISGALALRSGASLSEALVAAFQGAVVGAIGGGVGQYVQGLGGVTKGFGETISVGGARGLASGMASAYMDGARGSELVKAGLFGAATGVTCSTVVYGLDKLAQAYASNEGFGRGKPNTFGFAVSTENGGAHDLSKETQQRYLFGSDFKYGEEGFVEGGKLSRFGVAMGLNPTSQIHDGIQGALGGQHNVLSMIPACVVANYGIIAQDYPEFFTTGPKYRVFNLE